MPRTTTLARILTEMSVTSSVRNLAPGVAIIDPARMSSLRTRYADQAHYMKWLDKRYAATRFELGGASHIYCYVVTDEVSAPHPPSLYKHLLSEGTVTSSGSSNSSIVADGYDLYQIEQVITHIGVASGGTTYIEAQALQGTLGCPLLFGRSIGQRQHASVNPLQVLGLTAASGLNNLQQVKLDYSISNVATGYAPPVIDHWPLLVGPAVITRAEYYFDDNGAIMSFVSVLNSDLATYIEALVPHIVNQTDKANLVRRIALLRASPNDASIQASLPTGTNVFLMYPKTRPVAADVWSWTGVHEGLDFTLGHTFWDSAERPQYGVAGGAADIAYAATVTAGLEPNVNFNLSSVGLLTESSTGTIYPVDQLVLMARAIKATGRTVSITQPASAEYALLDPALRAAFEAARDAALAEVPVFETLINKNEDKGAVGLALISSGLSPLSTSVKDTLAAILKGSILDVYME